MDPVHHGPEKQRRDDDRNDPACPARDLRGVTEEVRRQRSQSEIQGHHGPRGQAVDESSLEQKIHVHQPITDHGIRKRERHHSQRKGRKLHAGYRRPPQDIGNGIQNSERRQSNRASPAQPFELLSDQRNRRSKREQIKQQYPAQEKNSKINRLYAVQNSK